MQQQSDLLGRYLHHPWLIAGHGTSVRAVPRATLAAHALLALLAAALPLGAAGACQRPDLDQGASAAAAPSESPASATLAPASASAPAALPRYWVHALPGLELRKAGAPDARVVAELAFGEAVDPVEPQPGGSWLHVRARRRDGWVRRQCLLGEPPAPIDDRKLSVLRELVRAVLSGAPLAPHVRREVDIAATASDRDHGSGRGMIRAPASALAGPLSIDLEMDGKGSHAAPGANKPHAFRYVLSLRKELAYLIGESCTAEITEQGARFSSLSGAHRLEIRLGDTADGWRASEIVLELTDPG